MENQTTEDLLKVAQRTLQQAQNLQEGKYAKMAADLRAMAVHLNKAADTLAPAPTAGVQVPMASRRGKLQPVIKDLKKQLSSGKKVTRDVLNLAYKGLNLTENQKVYIMNTLSAVKGVKKKPAPQGNKVELFMDARAKAHA